MWVIGWCAGVEHAERLAGAGVDYLECPLASLELENKDGAAERMRRYADSPLPVRAMNLFAPGDMKLVGPGCDEGRIRRYAQLAVEAASRIGTELIVLGSGRARMIPEDGERARAEQELLQVLAMIAEEWRGSGVTLALEPLNRKESNIVNSVAEAVNLVQQINSPAVRVLADFYHMQEEDEPLSTLYDHRDWLAHIHIADTGRRAPGTGTYPYVQFMQMLQDGGYSGRISAENAWPDTEEELAGSIAYMRWVCGSSVPAKP